VSATIRCLVENVSHSDSCSSLSIRRFWLERLSNIYKLCSPLGVAFRSLKSTKIGKHLYNLSNEDENGVEQE
jgi:hypothetical protein